MHPDKQLTFHSLHGRLLRLSMIKTWISRRLMTTTAQAATAVAVTNVNKVATIATKMMMTTITILSSIPREMGEIATAPLIVPWATTMIAAA
jgi:hypothetical protein